MGASASRVWTDICAIESEDVRAQMIGRVFSMPEFVAAAQQTHLYVPVMAWLNSYRAGVAVRFPYATAAGSHEQQSRDTIQHDSPRWAMYTTPAGSQQQQQQQQQSRSGTEMIVSPAAKALDYFQESLALLGIDEGDTITYDRLKAGYKRASLRAHPDKGGSKEAFDEVRRAFLYVEKILNRINPEFSAAEKARMTTQVTMENAQQYRTTNAPVALPDQPPISLSAKKLDMSMFNKLFEENRLPDPNRDTGYGDWLKSTQGSDEAAMDPRLKGKFNQDMFESVFREKAMNQQAGTAIVKRTAPEALVAMGGTELGAAAGNFTAAIGADVQFTDLKEAYTSGSTIYQEVADVRVVERKARSVAEAEAMRAQEMARVDPDESSRIAATAAALEERERQRRLRLAQQDTAAEGWHDQMRRRMYVTDR
jgi:hypothetical protein